MEATIPTPRQSRATRARSCPMGARTIHGISSTPTRRMCKRRLTQFPHILSLWALPQILRPPRPTSTSPRKVARWASSSTVACCSHLMGDRAMGRPPVTQHPRPTQRPVPSTNAAATHHQRAVHPIIATCRRVASSSSWARHPARELPQVPTRRRLVGRMMASLYMARTVQAVW